MEESVRRVLIAIGIALASLIIVVGGLSLSMAEDLSPVTATTTPSPSASPTLTPTLATGTVTPTLLSSVTPTLCVPPSGWVAVIVQEGQTLQSIALEYNTSVETLMQANCLSSADVPVGSLVYVPPKPSEPAPTRPACGPPAGWVIYIVRPGDTLYSIAVRYRVTVPQLMFANCLNSTVIYTGQRLYVPNVATSTPPPTLPGIITVTPSLTIPVELTTVVATTSVPVTDTPPPPTDTLPPPPTDTPVPPTDTVPVPTATTGTP